MAPLSVNELTNIVAAQTPQKAVNGIEADTLPSTNTLKKPLKLHGLLDKYRSFDVTPVIGKEFQDVDLAQWLKAPNSDELIRELAVTGLSPFTDMLRLVVNKL